MEDLGLELAPYLDMLSTELDAPAHGQNSYLSKAFKINSLDHANWDRMADWLEEQTRAYQAAFARLQEEQS